MKNNKGSFDIIIVSLMLTAFAGSLLLLHFVPVRDNSKTITDKTVQHMINNDNQFRMR